MSSKKYKILLALILIISICIETPAALAQPDLGLNYAQNLGLPNGEPRLAAINLIKLMMTFIGIIAVIIILYGGFVWMTSGGNEDRASQAKSTIGSGIVGLIIVLSAFLIVNFIVQNVTNALSQ